MALIEYTGIAELDDRLSYLSDFSAKRIAYAGVKTMARVVAVHIRRHIRNRLRPKTPDRGIGSRGVGARMSLIKEAKAGVGVGSANTRRFRIVNRGKRPGVGVSSANLHWFAMGTDNRFTGEKTVGSQKGLRRKKKTGKPRQFRGRIDKARFGGFVQKGLASARVDMVTAAHKVIDRMIAEDVAKGRLPSG